jgi:hypothetical protein
MGRPDAYVQTCTRSTLCDATVVQFEEASDYPRRPLFLEPDGTNVAPIGSGSQKLGKYAVNFTGSNFLWAPTGGAFPAGWFTVAVWVYPTVLGATNQKQYLLSEDGDNVPGNALYLQNQAGSLKAVIDLRDGIDPKNGTHITATSSGDISRNAWHLVVARLRPKTFISNGELSIQVDNGTPVTASVAVATWGGGGRLFAGKTNQPGSEAYFTGYMDQLAVAGVRWTDQETAFYWNGGAGLQYPFITGNTAYTTPTSTWRMDRFEASGSQTKSIVDDAAGGVDTVSTIPSGITIVSGSSCPLSGIDCTAFNGSIGTYVDFGPTPPVSDPGSQPWTLEGWVYLSNLLNTAYIYSLDYYNAVTQTDYPYVQVRVTTSGVLTLAWSGGSVADTSALSTGTWYYFVARYDGTNYKISHNGPSGGSTTGSATVVGPNASLKIGNISDLTKASLSGRLSMLSWYKGVSLSDSEVTAHYNSGSGRACCPFK